MNSLSSSWKAVLAFVALVLTNLSANFANSDVLTPQTLAEWVTLVVTTVVGTFAVYQKANKAVES